MAALLAAYGAVLAASPLPAPRPNRSSEEDDEERRGSFRTMLDVARDRRVWMIGAIGLLSGPFDETLLGFTSTLDLLVMGSRAYGPTRAVLLGGVSRKVTARSSCPVLVLPRGAEHPLRELLSSGQAA